jgi:hypothetical protein
MWTQEINKFAYRENWMRKIFGCAKSKHMKMDEEREQQMM